MKVLSQSHRSLSSGLKISSREPWKTKHICIACQNRRESLLVIVPIALYYLIFYLLAFSTKTAMYYEKSHLPVLNR